MARDLPIRRDQTERAAAQNRRNIAQAGNNSGTGHTTADPAQPLAAMAGGPGASAILDPTVAGSVAAARAESEAAPAQSAPWTRLTVEGLLYGLIAIAAVLTRFWNLGYQAQHHDESLHSYFSWLYYTGQGYAHDPLMHGPFLFHVAALSYWLFGDSDATSRYAAALFGAATVLLPWFLRRELGRWGALIASTMLLVSPSFLYFGRFHRHDVYSAFWTFLLFIAIIRFVHRPRPAWAFTGAAAWGFLFTNKEDFFIVTAIFGVALAFALFWATARRVIWLGVGLIVALGLVAKALPGLLGWAPLPAIPWESPTNEAIRSYVIAMLTHPLTVSGLLLLIGFVALAVNALSRQAGAEGWIDGLFGHAPSGTLVNSVHALLKDHRTLWIVLILFSGIYTVLYTSFFSNIPGILSGSFGAIGYWLAQHGVQRAFQPWFYYLLLLPQYDPLAAILGGFGVALTGWRLLAHRLGWGVEGPFPFVRGFIAWWAVASVGIYSWAGEKMPWMVIHLVLPLTLLAATLLGSALEGLLNRGLRIADRGFGAPADVLSNDKTRSTPVDPNPGSAIRNPQSLDWLAAGLIFVAVVAWFLSAARLSAGGVTVGENWWLLLLPLFVIIAIGVGYALVSGWRRGGQAVLLTLAAAFLLFHVHAGWRLAYQEGDVAKHMIVYVQTSPDVTRVMEELDEFSALMTGGKHLPIMYDSNTSWPFQWYLRDYTNKQFIGDTLANPPPDDIAIVLVGNENLAAHPELRQMLGNYVPQQYSMRWHFPEDETYRPFALAPELPPGWSAYRAESQPHGFLDVARSVWSSLAATARPSEQAELFRLLAYRDLKGAALGSYDFTIFVRKDLLPQYNDIRYR